MSNSPALSLDLESLPLGELSRQEIIRFYYSLTSEQEQFLLPLDHILEATVIILLRDQNHEVVALAGIRPGPFRSGLYFMVVRADHQGQGHGKRLMREVLQRFPCWRRLLMLTVHRSNAKARGLYRSLGFCTVHRQQANAIMLYRPGLGRWLRWPVTACLILRGLWNKA